MEDRHVAILLEEMRGQFKVFGEALQETNEKIVTMNEKIVVMDEKIDRLGVDMVDVKTRLTRVERAVTNGARKRKGQ